MRDGDGKQAVSDRSAAAAGAPRPDGSESRALVVLASTARPREAKARYHQVPFLVQLLAVKDQHPQTRARRRAAPQEVIAAYRSAAGLTRYR